MAGEIKINRITNGNVFLDGVSMLGRVEEFTAPTVKTKMAEHKALGLFGAVEFPAGIEKLEGKIKWNSFYPDAMAKVANPFQSLQLMIRGSVSNMNATGLASEDALVIIMQATFKDFPGGNFKQHDNVEVESNYSATSFKLTLGGVDYMEVDVLANIYKVKSLDVLAKYKQNIGG